MNRPFGCEMAVRKPDDSTMIVEPVGHKMLVRRVEYDFKDFLVGDPTVSEDELPDSMARLLRESLTKGRWVFMAEVLAVGRKCNTSRTKREMEEYADRDGSYRHFGRRYRVPRCMYNPARVGDLVALPESPRSGLMWRGVTGHEFDVMVDEGELLFIVRREDRPDWQSVKDFYKTLDGAA